MICAVIDTNVIVSALLTKNPRSPTARILAAVMDGKGVRPLHSPEIIAEYRKVLSRSQFNFGKGLVDSVIRQFTDIGKTLAPAESAEVFPDPDDKVFYCTALAARGDGAMLVTGNVRHFPSDPLVVTPAEFAALLETA